jgi:hypothetical protein
VIQHYCSGRSRIAPSGAVDRKEARQTTAAWLRRAGVAARPSYVPAAWQVKGENAYAMRERREREDAMHAIAEIEHCC